jgi:hypothetical protein
MVIRRGIKKGIKIKTKVTSIRVSVGLSKIDF